jgi:hypothetical protein
MRTNILSAGGLALALTIFISIFAPALAAPLGGTLVAQFTPFPTPTPGPDGRIIYIAVEGDSAWRISAIFGFTGDKYNELRTLNKWGDNPVIRPGDEIILGFSAPAEPTVAAGPSQTPAPILPTPSPEAGWGELCLILFNDLNGDSLRQESEPSLPGGAISISSRDGSISLTADTAVGFDHQCFKDLPEGRYNISIAIPEGYNPTTVLNYSLDILSGEINYVPFGAQANSETVAELPTPQGEGNSPWLGLLGGALVVAALGLAFFGGRFLRLK